MRDHRTAEQIVLAAFRGRTFVTIGEVIALVEEVIAATCGDSHGGLPRGHGTKVRPSGRRRKTG